jgi:two-component system, OmpR family, copper resistance phosphate regulon response regulator CusR
VRDPTARQREDDKFVIARLAGSWDNLGMRILVVEDEVKLAEYLRKGLTEEGFVVDVAHDGIDGLHLALEGQYEAIVLDRMLPGIDGLGVLAALRSKKPTPVLMLTALGRVEDRVSGLQGGADDYLVKPFAFSELVARLQALARRIAPAQHGSESTLLRLADLEVDLLRRKATRAGQRLDLTAKEFTLLTLLLRRQGEVLSRTELAEQVWDMNFDSETNVVEVAIRRLRSKLDAPFERPLLHTVRGMGYVLEERLA